MADTAKSSTLDILKNRKENVSNYLEQMDPESFDAYMIRDSLSKIESSIQKEVEKQVQQEKKAKEKLENPEKALLLELYGSIYLKFFIRFNSLGVYGVFFNFL